MLSEICVWDPESEFRDPRSGKQGSENPGSRYQNAPDPGSGSATLLPCYLRHTVHLFMIVVDSVDDVLLAVLDNPPDGAADHVARRHGGDAQALPLPAQAHRLVVLQLIHAAPGISQSINSLTHSMEQESNKEGVKMTTFLLLSLHWALNLTSLLANTGKSSTCYTTRRKTKKEGRQLVIMHVLADREV
jgi:hypothetical protein